jgi:hypothetical protein
LQALLDPIRATLFAAKERNLCVFSLILQSFLRRLPWDSLVESRFCGGLGSLPVVSPRRNAAAARSVACLQLDPGNSMAHAQQIRAGQGALMPAFSMIRA